MLTQLAAAASYGTMPSISASNARAVKPMDGHAISAKISPQKIALPISPQAEQPVTLVRYQTHDDSPEDDCHSALLPPGNRVLACTLALLRLPTDDAERAGLHAQRASAYYAAGAWEMALDDFTLALSHNPDLSLALNGRCWILASENLDLAGARRDCDRAIALDPSFHEAYDSRAIIDLREQDWAAAWEDFNTAVRLRADVPAFLYGRGLASLGLGDNLAAQRDMTSALALNASVAAEYRKLGFDAELQASKANPDDKAGDEPQGAPER